MPIGYILVDSTEWAQVSAGQMLVTLKLSGQVDELTAFERKPFS